MCRNSRPLVASLRVVVVLGILCSTLSAGENDWTSQGPDVIVNRVVADTQRQWLYAGTSEGVYERAFDDSIWTPMASSLADHNVLSFAVDETDGRLYAGTSQGLFVSANAGTLWTAAVEPGSGIMSLATGLTTGRVYVGTFGRGIYSSQDGGNSWTRGDVPDAIVYDIAPAFDDQTVYAATASGILVSSDNGLTWAAPGDQLTTTSVRSIHLGPAVDAGTVTIATYGRGVLRSVDGGISWTELNGSDDRPLSPLQVRALAIDSVNPRIMYAATATGGFLRTQDGGGSWLRVNTGLPQLTARDIVLPFEEQNQVLGTGTGDGVWEIRFADAPQIDLAPVSIDFGPVPIGSRQMQTVIISNSGKADLVVHSLRMGGASGFTISLPDSIARLDSIVIAPGNSTFVEVIFEPKVRDELLRDELRITSSDPDETERALAVVGRGTQAVLSVEPDQIDFGAIRMPSADVIDSTLRLTNSGSASLRLLGASFTNSRFRVLDFAPQTLAPGQGADVRVSFNPLLPRSETATLLLISESLETTDGVTDTLRVSVTGTGTAPDIGASSLILDFGQVDIGQQQTLPLEVTNTGTAPLTITRVTARSDQFDVDRTLGVPRDTVFTVPAQDTILIVAGGDTALSLDTGSSTVVEVSGDTTWLVAGSDTTRIVSGADTTSIIVGGRRTVFSAAADSTVLQPDSTFVFRLTYRPTMSGPRNDTLDIFSDAPLRFGQLSVLLRGEGNALSLEPAPVIPLGVYPVDLVVTALDNVNGVDIAVVDSSTGRLHILRNDGGGEFPAVGHVVLPDDAAPYPAWAEPVTIAAGPIFNRGGPTDLVIGDRVAKSLSVLSNDGQGRFSGRREDLFIGHNLSDVVVVDLDADGDQDIVVANGLQSSSITLLYNDGQGNFSARAVLTSQSGATEVAAGQLDADGYVDLVVANTLANTVSVYLNDRNGGFAGAVHYLVGVSPGELALADIDADGHVDIAASTTGESRVSLLRNTGAGVFTSLNRPDALLRATAIAAGGLTADIFDDFVVGGQGDFLVFLENTSGSSYSNTPIELGFPIRRVKIADIDNNGVGDIIAMSADSGRLQLLHNRLVGRLIRPRAPIAVVAQDVKGDLGGRISVSWEDGDYGLQATTTQIIPTTSYTVVRSADLDFNSVDTLAVVPGGIFSYQDVDATPYSTFYYQVTAEREGLPSAPSAPASARSVPAPLIDVRLSNAPRVSLGDTLIAEIYLTPADHDIAGVSVFMTYEPTALQLIPSETDVNKPFRVASDLAGSFTAAINSYHSGAFDSTGKVDLTLISTVPSSVTPLTASVEPVLVARLHFLANVEASTFLSVDDEEATNRRTAVVERGTGVWIEPVLQDSTKLTVRDAFVSGQIQVQQRGTAAINGDLATLLFIDSADDTLFSPLNDEDRLQPGIQVSLSDQGRFTLDQIPGGSYRVFAKVATHLQGIVVGDTVTIDSSRRHLTFRWVAPDTSALSLLPAGDANDDNRVNLADFGVLVRHYGETPSSSSDWAVAQLTDFNGDERVNFDDFMLLADNFGRIGMRVLSSARLAAPQGRVWVSESGILHGEDLGAIAGLTLLIPATTQVSFDGTVFDGSVPRMHRWPATQGRVRLALVLAESDTGPVSGEGPLMNFTGVEPALINDQLEGVEVLAADGTSRSVLRTAALPQATKLGVNYPNPFNPTTTIPFDLSSRGPVRLEVFDILGQRVRTLVADKILNPGQHQIVWLGQDDEGHEVASGRYFYRLRVGPLLQSRSLLLLR